MWQKAIIAKLAEKAFEKAGGVDGIKDKGLGLAKSVKKHAGNTIDAVKHASVEEAAETLGEIVGDVTNTAKDAGIAAIEIGAETIQDGKDFVQEMKDLVSGSNTETKVQKDTVDADEEYVKVNDFVHSLIRDGKTIDKKSAEDVIIALRGLEVDEDKIKFTQKQLNKVTEKQPRPNKKKPNNFGNNK